MRQFKDNAGRDWSLEISTVERKSVLKATSGKVDFFGAFDGTLQVALSDIETLVDTLYCLCGEQIEKLALSPEQFARALTGDALEAAAEALKMAVADFFPTRQRLLMQKALAKQTEVDNAIYQKGMEKLDQLADRSLTAGMEKLENLQIPDLSSGSSSTLPQSLESTQAT